MPEIYQHASSIGRHKRNGSSSIVLFDVEHDSRFLCIFNLATKSIAKIQEYPDEVKYPFTAISLAQYLYIFGYSTKRGVRCLYRLELNGSTAETWQQMCEWPAVHGWSAPLVAASSKSLFLVGGGWVGRFSRSVSKYDPSADHWQELPEKSIATSGSTLLCNDQFLYCLGGFGEDHKLTGRVERMELKTEQWTEIAKIHQSRYVTSAAEWQEKILIVYIEENWLTAETWDPRVDQWKGMKLLYFDRHTLEMCAMIEQPIILGAFAVNEKLYIVSKDGVMDYDLENRKFISYSPFHKDFTVPALLDNIEIAS